MKARKKRYHLKCNTQVVREKELMETNYPWYCPCCSENIFNFEVYKTKKKRKLNYKKSLLNSIVDFNEKDCIQYKNNKN